jgi:raffinose/stachyose/melibiose transport system substrate-binding protein
VTQPLQFLRQSGAAIAIVGAFIWSAIVITNTREKEQPAGATVIRVGHWQLEPGFREALQHVISRYEALHPNVKVIIDSIPESTYAQWITTQLMGETAPDVIEIGHLTRPIWIGYFSRYFIPLSDFAGLPNPYNKGTNLEGVPLRSTFKDGLASGYVEELQEIMRIPVSQHNVGLCYNKTLLKQLTGLEHPPTEYRAFLALCDKIAAQKNPRGQPYIPIAGQPPMWEDRAFPPVSFRARESGDNSRDGLVSTDELFLAFRNGTLSFDSPPIRMRLKMVREVTAYFPNGYVGLKRDEMVFMFMQQRAVFLSAGTWDAAGLQLQSTGKFELGFTSFPRPAVDDPEYAGMIPGPVYENTLSVSPPFGVNRASHHPDVAIDFLLFLTSQKINEEFNRIAYWIPAVNGAETVDFMKQLEPRLEGIYGTIPFLFVGPNTEIAWAQVYSAFQARPRNSDPNKDFEEAMEEVRSSFEPLITGEMGFEDFSEFERTLRRNVERNEQLVSLVRGRVLTSSKPDSRDTWTKYRALVRDHQTWPDAAFTLPRAIAEKRRPHPQSYRYTPEALERIRKDAANRRLGSSRDSQPGSPAQ